MSQANNPDAAVHTERLISADVCTVFAAFARPDRRARWRGPRGFTNTFKQFEFRPGAILSRMRKLIKEADPEVVEEWKWTGSPVWSHDGIIRTGESYRQVVKLTFAKDASLPDPARLFNARPDGNVRRATDLHEGADVDEAAFRALVRQAVALNGSGKAKAARKAKS